MALMYLHNNATYSVLLFHLEASSPSFKPPLHERTDIASYAQKLKEKAESFEAWDGSLLVGMVNVYMNCGTEKSEGDGFISNVSVLPKFQRRGIARQLLVNCITEVQRHGIVTLRLRVSTQNGSALSLYRSLGFTEVNLPKDEVEMVWYR